MKIAIASGKGGTGKTTVAAALSVIWPGRTIAVDLDVEEPNLHLFVKPRQDGQQTAFLDVPVADAGKCTYCKACADLCQFGAISVLGEVLLTFPEMCHGCGGCMAVCLQGALSRGRRELGDILWGHAGEKRFLMGRTRVGEAMSPPMIREVKSVLEKMLQDLPADVIIDAPPGVSCPAVNAVMDSDVIVLVTEPTPFGLYDLRLAHDAFLPLGKPMGLVINRAGLGEDHVYRFGEENALPLWGEIPFSRSIAEAYSRAGVIVDLNADLNARFVRLCNHIRKAMNSRREVAHA